GQGANANVRLLQAIFNFAIKRKWMTENPASEVELVPFNKRDRHLSADELGRLRAALDWHPQRIVTGLIEFLITTGCRRDEGRLATWDMFDLDAAIWRKPAQFTKQK